MQGHPPPVPRRREGRGEEQRRLGVVAAGVEGGPDRVELLRVGGVGVLEVGAFRGRDEVGGEVTEGVELADDRPHRDLVVAAADRHHPVGDRDDGTEVPEAADRSAEHPLLPRRGQLVLRRRSAGDQLALPGAGGRSSRSLPFFAVGGREAREAVAGQRPAGGGVFGRHGHGRNHAERLQGLQDRAPGRAGADPTIKPSSKTSIVSIASIETTRSSPSDWPSKECPRASRS